MAKKEQIELPLISVANLVAFPHHVIPIVITHEIYLQSLEAAMNGEKIFFLVTKKLVETDTSDPNKIVEEIYQTGTICKIFQIFKGPGKSIQVLVEPRARATIKKVITHGTYPSILVEPITLDDKIDNNRQAFMKILQEIFSEYCLADRTVSPEIRKKATKIEFPNQLVDLISGAVKFSLLQKIELLQITDTTLRLEKCVEYLQLLVEMTSLQHRIETTVRTKLDKRQKEFFLNEQIKQINKELGRQVDEEDEIEILRKRIEGRELPDEVREKVNKEFSHLQALQPMSPESGILRFYIDWLLDLPWYEKSEDNKDIKKAEAVLNHDHYDLEKAKERILDFIAIKQLNETAKGPILCLVGPPGTGKTSLGKSVAKALDREFIRISLGGVRDEAEIRGHRKTYIGALPGKIIQSMKKAKTINPVFLLDEIDKMSSDFRGDPASALLEVLDPEQNYNFTDHYLEIPYDLSKVMFICTANSAHNIPIPLRDRMEIIDIPGYTDYEKIKIAQNFILPKQMKENGLETATITLEKEALLKIITEYTMESGVRNLERKIANIIRKVGRKAIEEGRTDLTQINEQITQENIFELLGRAKFNRDVLFKTPKIGNINGLAWTESGGTLLPVEAITFEGKGDLILTGSLGDVMKESARTALSYIKAHRHQFGLPKDFYSKTDIHLHVPEGAIPKDGPSAGITIAAALFSTFAQKKPKNHFAMTGEITLTGKVLPIGGLKEKTLAAYRNGMKEIILPFDNKKDLEDIPEEIRKKLKFHFVKEANEVIETLFSIKKNLKATQEEKINEEETKIEKKK